MTSLLQIVTMAMPCARKRCKAANIPSQWPNEIGLVRSPMLIDGQGAGLHVMTMRRLLRARRQRSIARSSREARLQPRTTCMSSSATWARSHRPARFFFAPSTLMSQERESP